MLRLRYLLVPVLFALTCIVCLTVIQLSEQFQSCIENAQYKAAQTTHQKQLSDVPVTLIMRERCWGDYVDRYGNGIVAMFTIVLAASTIGLWFVTDWSANIASRALTELERPYLFVLDYNWLLMDKAEANDVRYGWIYSVRNGGKLPAFIKSVKYGTGFGETIPQVDDVPEIHDLLTAPLVAAGENREVIQKFDDESGEPTRKCEIKGGMAVIPGCALKYGRLIAKITIEYDGPITKGHTTTACWEWHPIKHAFTQYGGPEHNQRT